MESTENKSFEHLFKFRLFGVQRGWLCDETVQALLSEQMIPYLMQINNCN